MWRAALAPPLGLELGLELGLPLVQPPGLPLFLPLGLTLLLLLLLRTQLLLPSPPVQMRPSCAATATAAATALEGDQGRRCGAGARLAAPSKSI